MTQKFHQHVGLQGDSAFLRPFLTLFKQLLVEEDEEEEEDKKEEGGSILGNQKSSELEAKESGGEHDLFEPPRRLPVKKTRQQLQREKALLEQSQKLGLLEGSASLPPDQRLSAPKQRASTQKPHSSPTWTCASPAALTSPVGDGELPGTESQPREAGLENSHNGHENLEVLPSKTACNLEKKKVELQEKSHWQVLQQEQRLMEEKNKRKKALLAKAIAERSKRTQAETMKLKRIQKELQALDDMVSADIGILRNRIDQASLEYSYARKRFDRAETEYVNAKLDLQRKTEIKEQLTEHLCTIIQQNELRKANKLEELMQQLDVQPDEESLDLKVEMEEEAEARKQMVAVERPCQPAPEGVTPGLTKKSKNSQEQAVSPKGDEQCENSSSFSHPSPDYTIQELGSDEPQVQCEKQQKRKTPETWNELCRGKGEFSVIRDLSSILMGVYSDIVVDLICGLELDSV
ncbi:RAB6-interacting golgin [Octodon degus]|uniref:RAB6-interacting golgin n=1 Tax=Octodon degus TaxID=10160 RepID=A0A6P3VCZ1_OCTDE|nr:RAB6-interacting golgin [Octodon degus]